MTEGRSREMPMELEEREFIDLRDIIYAHSGVFFSEATRFIIEKRLAKRVRHYQLTGFRDYYYFLRYDTHGKEELQEVIDLVTTNETYFFRESAQLRTFAEEILPLVVKEREGTRARGINIWSAGCSSGEEPYTISMLLFDHPLIRGWTIRIFASDISRKSLTAARRGEYSGGSFRSTARSCQERFFEEKDGRLRLKDALRKPVQFMHHNILDRERLNLLPPMDVIFCRNVFIYFDEEAKRRATESFFKKLRPAGFLLLGHSESLINLSTEFELRHFRHDMVYRKPKVGEREER